ncbi:MAG: GlsB/YeaQ/YmgE family stress response membrane protein [Cyanobacteria bacterium Co-bin8]|nr:GlsB/YeaQ/YmgE family stress response membrane protein [Cyanobacteria bacterium Co-bin8]
MMDLRHLLIQLVIAIVCAGVAGILIPRKMPGGAVGLLIIGLAGAFLGQWTADYLQQQYGFTNPALEWNVEEVAILPSIVGSAIVLYLVTAFLTWGRYGNR